MLEISLNETNRLVNFCKALSTPLRVNILHVLNQFGPLNIQEIAEKLDSAPSTISINVKVMEEAGLIISDKTPAKNGSNKICSPIYLDIHIKMQSEAYTHEFPDLFEYEIPIGNFQRFDVWPSCGYLFFDHDDKLIKNFHFDNKHAFLFPERIDAQLLWFRMGYVEYHIPIERLANSAFESIAFSLELCSEAPGYNLNWKSDISMWINGHEIGTWVSPADYGGKQGLLTPNEWGVHSTQYGVLTDWRVDKDGSYINDLYLSGVNIDDLALGDDEVVKLRIGIKDTAENLGGINLFGDRFGNYPQNIKMRIQYRD